MQCCNVNKDGEGEKDNACDVFDGGRSAVGGGGGVDRDAMDR